jgi:hypothetical protein
MWKWRERGRQNAEETKRREKIRKKRKEKFKNGEKETWSKGRLSKLMFEQTGRGREMTIS